MRIIIQEIQDHKEYYDTLNIVGKKVFDFKFDYVYQRLEILAQELLEEENNNEMANIRIFMEAQHPNDMIEFKGYTDKLSERIRGCFTSVDTKSFENMIYQLRDETLN